MNQTAESAINFTGKFSLEKCNSAERLSQCGCCAVTSGPGPGHDECWLRQPDQEVQQPIKATPSGRGKTFR